MVEHEVEIRVFTLEDSSIVKDLMDQYWGGEPLVVHHKNYYPSKMDGFLAFKNQHIVGFLFYDRQDTKCEIIVLEALEKFNGIGSKLLSRLIADVKQEGCRIIKVMTTNDNLDALRFYQRRGFVITGINVNELEAARQMKPTIPEIGDYDIPLRDAILLEYQID